MAEKAGAVAGSRSLRPLARMAPFLTRYKLQIALALMALIIASVATLAVPLAVRSIIDHGFSTANTAVVDKYFAMMLGVVFLLAISSATRFYYVMWLGEKNRGGRARCSL